MVEFRKGQRADGIRRPAGLNGDQQNAVQLRALRPYSASPSESNSDSALDSLL